MTEPRIRIVWHSHHYSLTARGWIVLIVFTLLTIGFVAGVIEANLN